MTPPNTRQQGIALVISLIFLLITTLAALSAVQLSANQERMAANTRFKVDSFQAAEAALRVAEKIIQDDPAAFALTCSGASCNVEESIFDIDSVTAPVGWQVISASAQTNGMTLWYRIINLGESHAPVNVLSAAPGTLYKIVVVSFRGATRTILETVYVRSQA